MARSLRRLLEKRNVVLRTQFSAIFCALAEQLGLQLVRRWSVDKAKQYWERAFRSGKLHYLHAPAEQLRLRTIASMIADACTRHGRVRLIDIGCGEGLLLPLLPTTLVGEYVAVDLSRAALDKVPESVIPTRRIASSLADFSESEEIAGPVVIVASEVLYYDEHGVDHLQKLAGLNDCREVIVSCVAGRPDKPNWTNASKKLWSELRQTGWGRLDRQVVDASDLAWDIVRFSPAA